MFQGIKRYTVKRQSGKHASLSAGTFREFKEKFLVKKPTKEELEAKASEKARIVEESQRASKSISIGDRCEVGSGTEFPKRGKVVYVGMFTVFCIIMTSQEEKKLISPPRKSKKKKINLTIDLLSLGIYAPGPQVLTYRPQILRGVRI